MKLSKEQPSQQVKRETLSQQHLLKPPHQTMPKARTTLGFQLRDQSIPFLVNGVGFGFLTPLAKRGQTKLYE